MGNGNLKNVSYPAKPVGGAPTLIRSEGAHGTSNLMQDLLEPELVGLVNCDEEQLVMFFRAGSLEAEKFIKRQVTRVR